MKASPVVTKNPLDGTRKPGSIGLPIPNVTVTYLPSMIRIDGKHRFDVVYADVDEAAGEEPGWFNAAEFEESMSTHYGRMIHEDDRTIMFANPEDAAEFLDFDLVARA